MIATRIVFLLQYKLHKHTTSQEAMMLLDKSQWIHDGTVKRASGWHLTECLHLFCRAVHNGTVPTSWKLRLWQCQRRDDSEQTSRGHPRCRPILATAAQCWPHYQNGKEENSPKKSSRWAKRARGCNRRRYQSVLKQFVITDAHNQVGAPLSPGWSSHGSTTSSAHGAAKVSIPKTNVQRKKLCATVICAKATLGLSASPNP